METTIFVYSSGKLIAEYSTKLADYPATNYTTTDQLGTPRVITDQTGAVKARRDFMPFGEELYAGIGGRTGDTGQKYSSNKDEIRQKFTGYQNDKETGLDFAEARMYNNNNGRFTAVDPLLASGKSANPQTFNRYAYVVNNPIILTDPTGLIGDYYTRSGRYIGTDDNPTDGKVYFGDIGSKKGDVTYVINAERTTSVAVLHAQNWYARSNPSGIGALSNFINGFPDKPFEHAATGFGKGVGNIGIGMANLASTAAWVNQTGGYTSNPFSITEYSYNTQIEKNFGYGAIGASIFAGGVAAAPFRAGSALTLATGETGGLRVAFGVGEHLEEFSNATNSTNYFREFGANARFDSFKFMDLAQRADRINFNYQGVSLESFNAYRAAGNPLPGHRLFTNTNFELDHILTTPEILNKSRFFNYPK